MGGGSTLPEIQDGKVPLSLNWTASMKQEVGLVFWVLWHINLRRLFNAKSILLKTIQLSISTQFNCQKHFYFKLFKQLYVTIQLSVNTVLMLKNSSISNNSVKHKHAV